MAAATTGHVGLVAGKRLEGDREWFVGFSRAIRTATISTSRFTTTATPMARAGLDGGDYQKVLRQVPLGQLAGDAN